MKIVSDSHISRGGLLGPPPVPKRWSDSPYLKGLKAALNGCDMGGMNHKDHFPRMFRPFVRDEIHNNTKSFLTTKLAQTGFEPADNISADKGTNVHRS